jgi:hypothetical protein
LTKQASDLVPRVAFGRSVLGWWALLLDFELIPWVGVADGGWRSVPEVVDGGQRRKVGGERAGCEGLGGEGAGGNQIAWG